MRRRTLLAAGLGLPPILAAAHATVHPDTRLHFPRDHGAHPQYRTEWWYVTGALEDETQALPWGFQITFFRSRNDRADHNPSAFTPRQLIFAHVALTDLAHGRLRHDQRIAREGFGVAQAATADTDLRLRDWTLQRDGPIHASVYRARLASRDFALRLDIAQTQPVLLQGQAGYSRKGPDPAQASHYYSHPQMAVQGRLRLLQREHVVRGRAWLDHEWSEALMHPDAVGWDWVGMNLDDGAALTAFQLRRRDGRPLWAGGSWRAPGQAARSFGPDEVGFQPGRLWVSPATQARYPVEWTLQTPVGRFLILSRLDAQELDSRATTGTIYWEGLSELRDMHGRRLGQGYLEMTGYVRPVKL